VPSRAVPCATPRPPTLGLAAGKQGSQPWPVRPLLPHAPRGWPLHRHKQRKGTTPARLRQLRLPGPLLSQLPPPPASLLGLGQEPRAEPRPLPPLRCPGQCCRAPACSVQAPRLGRSTGAGSLGVDRLGAWPCPKPALHQRDVPLGPPAATQAGHTRRCWGQEQRLRPQPLGPTPLLPWRHSAVEALDA